MAALEDNGHRTPRALGVTSNLIQLHLHACGTSEVPGRFHLWAFLATMAACVADRVGIRKFEGQLVAPNMYTLLVGPSGSGKGEAIDAVLPYVKHPEVERIVHPHDGPITGQGIYQMLDRLRKKTRSSKVFLVHEELAFCLGEGKEAREFVTHVVGMWKPKSGEAHKETVTRGQKITKDRCINWLGGSDWPWLLDVIPSKTLSAGMGRRLVIIEDEPNPSVRYTRPIYPWDTAEVREHIQDRLLILAHVEGEVTLSPAARALEEDWYLSREPPKSREEWPYWRQEHDLVLKLVQLLVLADGGDLHGTTTHWEVALDLLKDATKSRDRIKEMSLSTIFSQRCDMVAGLVARYGGMSYPMMMQKSKLAKRDLGEVVEHLTTTGRVKRVRSEFTGTYRFLPAEPMKEDR